MYEMRIENRHSFGGNTYRKECLNELHKILENLIIDDCTDVKVYEIKEIKPSWLNEFEKYNPIKHKLTDSQSRTLYYSACVEKKFVKEKNESS